MNYQPFGIPYPLPIPTLNTGLLVGRFSSFRADWGPGTTSFSPGGFVALPWGMYPFISAVVVPLPIAELEPRPLPRPCPGNPTSEASADPF